MQVTKNVITFTPAQAVSYFGVNWSRLQGTVMFDGFEFRPSAVTTGLYQRLELIEISGLDLEAIYG